MAVAWVAVQSAWRRAFPDAVPDPDVLAGRMGCRGLIVRRLRPTALRIGAGSAEEEMS